MTTCPADPIPSGLVKRHIDTLLPAFVHMVNLSLQSGAFPMLWKRAYVTPLLKKPSLDIIPNNYRPVSNLPLVSKFTERVVVDQLLSHMNSHAPLPSYQSAYRAFHSTETALVKLANDILLSMDRQHSTLLVAVDLSAAFDTVHHGILLSVMQSKFGATGPVLDWCSSYLYPREYVVAINSGLSAAVDLPFSVPQGSVAGPVLFNCYSSTLAESITTISSDRSRINIVGYADDHSFYTHFKSGNTNDEHSAVSSMTDVLGEVKIWMAQNKLQMNDAKTEVIVFKSQYYNDKTAIDSILVGESQTDVSEHVKLLGVQLDSNMSLKSHITNRVRIASCNLNRIRRIRKFLNYESCKSVILGLVISHLDYCNALLLGLPSTSLLPLQSIQNQAAKLILNKRKYDSASECMRSLHWLPIAQRIKFKAICLVFKCIHKQAPDYLCAMLNMRVTSYNIRSVSSNTLYVPTTRTKRFGDRAFSVFGPKLWNELPPHLRDESTFSSFKRSLKTHLFREVFG